MTKVLLVLLALIACKGEARDVEKGSDENPLAPGWVPYKKERDAYRAWLYRQEFIPVDYYPDAATCDPGPHSRKVSTVKSGEAGASSRCREERLPAGELCGIAKVLASSGQRAIVYPGEWHFPPWPALNQTTRYALLHRMAKRWLYLVSETGRYYAARKETEIEVGCVVEATGAELVLVIGHRIS